MPDRFTLLTLSFSLILHNVCSWEVSEPLIHTLKNDDGSVSVTCMYWAKGATGLEAKLKMNNKYVCEISDKEDGKCKWRHDGNAFTFTLMNPEALHTNEFSCEISKIEPLPIQTYAGPKMKLFRGCSNDLPSPKINCSCPIEEHTPKVKTPEDKTPNEDMYTLLICGLIIVVVMLSIYSIILTVFYIRLRVTNPEPSDNLTYVPMQRNVKRRDPDNTEYVDMREVQKRGGSHRDMNHNSHLIIV
ncbi:uncharacterized protein si:ch211-67e16.3 [Megalobrama amblycephala]|uniref:uncharacterized protein si:ch211-67e16.3 n=1 Tax=Megalobrama amblycephala TaxID=75352 RepID=UPI002013C3D5|nr:uncharacterized protein si:ch211-67e16.3 [Megalobrama amblycephala]